MAQRAAAAGTVEVLRLGLRPCGPFQLARTPSADTLRRALTLMRPADLETLTVDGKVLRAR